MGTVWARNYRQTLNFVSDISPEVFDDGKSGWVAPHFIYNYDIDEFTDRRLAGYISTYNGGIAALIEKSYTIIAGTYELRLAIPGLTAGGIPTIRIYDDLTLKATLTGTVGYPYFMDAMGNAHAPSSWDLNNKPRVLTFTSTTLRVVLGPDTPDEGLSGIAHISLAATTANEEALWTAAADDTVTAALEKLNTVKMMLRTNTEYETVVAQILSVEALLKSLGPVPGV